MTKRKRLILCAAVLLTVCAASTAEAQLREPAQRFFISIDGGFQSGSQQLQHQVVTPEVYGEDQITETDYNMDRSGAALRANVAARLWGNLGFGVGYTQSSATGEGTATVEAPHPLFFDRPRIVSTTLTDLGHQEDLFHFQALFIVPVNDRVLLQIFGGPSAMTVKQSSVVGATTVEVGPPFTAVTLESVEVRQMTKTALGFNVGLDLAYMLRENYGAGLFVQYNGGSIDFDESGGPPGVKVGGIQFGGGLRFRF